MQVAEFSGNIDNIIGYRKVPSDNETISQFIKWRNPFNHPTVVINKKVLDKVGGYLPFCNLEDYYLWARIIGNHYQVFNLPDVLTYMRVDNGLYSRRGHLRNLLYFYKLRNLLRKNRLINYREQFMGDFVMSVNI